jgi:hypothetical protein
LLIAVGVMIEIRRGPFKHVSGQVQHAEWRGSAGVGCDVLRIFESRFFGVRATGDPFLLRSLSRFRGEAK